MSGVGSADERQDAQFTDFMRVHSTGLLRLAYLLTADKSAAEDLFQESAARVYVSWEHVMEAGDPWAYVRRLVLNTNRRSYRRRRVSEVFGVALAEAVPSDDSLSQIDDRLHLARLLAELPLGQRSVVVLRCCEDLSEREVATVLGCSVGTVKAQLSRGLSRLKGLLSPPDVPVPSGGPTRQLAGEEGMEYG